MAQIVEINECDLNDHVEKGNLTLLLIWIKRCDQCDAFKPVFEQLTESYPDATFLSMNMLSSMENLRCAEQYEIETTPIVPVFCHGELLDTFVGYYTFDEFREKFEEIRREHNC
jgi:thioredoxin-like negative regulator of GroEL